MNEIRKQMNAKNWDIVANLVEAYFRRIVDSQWARPISYAVHNAINLFREMCLLDVHTNYLAKLCDSTMVCYSYFLQHTEPHKRGDYNAECFVVCLLKTFMDEDYKLALKWSDFFRKDLMSRSAHPGDDISLLYAGRIGMIFWDDVTDHPEPIVTLLGHLREAELCLESIHYYAIGQYYSLETLTNMVHYTSNSIDFSLVDSDEGRVQFAPRLYAILSDALDVLIAKTQQDSQFLLAEQTTYIEKMIEILSCLTMLIMLLKRPTDISLLVVKARVFLLSDQLLDMDSESKYDFRLCLDFLLVAGRFCPGDAAEEKAKDKDAEIREWREHLGNTPPIPNTVLLERCLLSQRMHFLNSKFHKSVYHTFAVVVQALTLMSEDNVCTRRDIAKDCKELSRMIGCQVEHEVTRLEEESLVGQDVSKDVACILSLHSLCILLQYMSLEFYKKSGNASAARIDEVFARLLDILDVFSRFCLYINCAIEDREREFLAQTWKIIEISAKDYWPKVKPVLAVFTKQLKLVAENQLVVKNSYVIHRVEKYIEDIVSLFKNQGDYSAALDFIEDFLSFTNIFHGRLLQLQDECRAAST